MPDHWTLSTKASMLLGWLAIGIGSILFFIAFGIDILSIGAADIEQFHMMQAEMAYYLSLSGVLSTAGLIWTLSGGTINFKAIKKFLEIPN